MGLDKLVRLCSHADRLKNSGPFGMLFQGPGEEKRLTPPGQGIPDQG